jgi:O-acetyl-ADP-ribose deacetylase (regulator of RNase III)
MIDFDVVVGDITKYSADLIISTYDRALPDGGKLNQAIHSAAGKSLLRETSTLEHLSVGKLKLTNAYNLPATFVLHSCISLIAK